MICRQLEETDEIEDTSLRLYEAEVRIVGTEETLHRKAVQVKAKISREPLTKGRMRSSTLKELKADTG